MPKSKAIAWGKMKGTHKIRIPLKFIAEVAGVTYRVVQEESKTSKGKLFNRKDLHSIVAYINRTRKKKELPILE